VGVDLNKNFFVNIISVSSATCEEIFLHMKLIKTRCVWDQHYAAPIHKLSETDSDTVPRSRENKQFLRKKFKKSARNIEKFKRYPNVDFSRFL
jgi:hypothetical protein